jgi:alanine racemase
LAFYQYRGSTQRRLSEHPAEGKREAHLFKNAVALVYSKDYPLINEGIASYLNPLRNGVSSPKMHFFNWSYKTAATLQVIAVVKERSRTKIAAVYQERSISIEIPFTDDASVENAITCWCVLLYLETGEEEIRQQFLKLSRIAMRLELIKGINNCSIINDSYSADLSSLRIALDYLSSNTSMERKPLSFRIYCKAAKPERTFILKLEKRCSKERYSASSALGPLISRHSQLFKSIPGLQSEFHPDVESFRKDFTTFTFSNETVLLKGARIFEFERISQLLEQKVHQTVLEIDQDALLHNLRNTRNCYNPPPG